MTAFDQIIYKCFNPAEGPNPGWDHISQLKPGKGALPRHFAALHQEPSTGQYTYVQDLRGTSTNAGPKGQTLCEIKEV